jgi:hypothetical protein
MSESTLYIEQYLTLAKSAKAQSAIETIID